MSLHPSFIPRVPRSRRALSIFGSGMNAEVLVGAQQEYGTTVIGPPHPKPSWHSERPGAYTADDFLVDWAARRPTCPQGKRSVSGSESRRRTGEPFIGVHFSLAECLSCPARECCTRSRFRAQHLFLKPQAQHEALHAMPERISSEEGRELYRVRASVEGTISQAVRLCGLRQARYRGLEKAHLQNVATAAAINVSRISTWCDGRPHTPSRVSLRPAHRMNSPTVSV